MHRLFGKQWIACLGFLLIAFHPRMFAHSFFNTKDIPLLSMFFICLSVVEAAFRKNKWNWHLLLGIVCGYTTSIRILALVLLPCLFLFYFMDIFLGFYKKERVRKPVSHAIIFLVSFCLTLYVALPILWGNPFRALIENYKSMAHFRWDGTVLFFGEMIRSTKLPWTYLPTWISITIPLLWLFTGFAGIITIIFLFIKQPLKYLSNTKERNFLLYVFCCLVPVWMVILLKSVVYDDWRHLYFTYPAFILLALLIMVTIY